MPSFQEKPLPATITVPSSSSYLNIDTRDQLRYDADGYIENAYQNPFDIKIYKPDTIFQGRVLRIALTNFNMLWSCPNVNPRNDYLVLERNDPANPGQIERHGIELGAIQASQNFGIATGFYTGSTLADAIQTYLNSTDATLGLPLWGNTTWVCTFSTSQGTFTISTGKTTTNTNVPLSPYAFRVNPMLGKNLGSREYAYTGEKYQRTSTLANMMGYLNASKVMADVQYSDTASMIYTRYIDIVSDQLTAYQYTRDASTSSTTGRNLIARIFLNKSPGINSVFYGTDHLGETPFTINFEPKNVKYMKWDQRTFLSNLNIKVLDEFGDILYDQLPGKVTSIVPPLPSQPPVPAPVPLPTYQQTGNSGSSSYCQMTFTITEGDN